MASSPADSAPAHQAASDGQAPAPGQPASDGQAPAPGQAASDGPPPAPGLPAPAGLLEVRRADGGAAPGAFRARACASCGAALSAGQDWCLECGAGAPGSLGRSGWRPAALALAAVLALVLGAAAAAYAALEKGPSRARVLTATVAQTTTPATSVPTAPAPTAPALPGAAAHGSKARKGLLGLGAGKPPKIPLTAITPKASEKAATGKGATGTPASEPKKTTPTSTAPSSSTGGSGEKGTNGESSEESQAAILLDTNAAKTYDPYDYPASWFGDPSLAIDGDESTAWTAQVNPATAPKMAEGLLIDLKSKQRLAVLQLLTSTTGMTVQVYGADTQTAPSSITEPAWVPLSAPKLVRKRKLRLALRDATKGFRFITLWISKAPQSAVGTPEAPGHVSVNEVELFATR
ncbi:MAG TPA: hypothetical protein VMF09_05715 [Solirubrobacteraceae bacterium]|nr:hypothetical protein [Solirubrobacteraceae bacterium]